MTSFPRFNQNSQLIFRQHVADTHFGVGGDFRRSAGSVSPGMPLHVTNPSKYPVKFLRKSSGGSNLIDTAARNPHHRIFHTVGHIQGLFFCPAKNAILNFLN